MSRTITAHVTRADQAENPYFYIPFEVAAGTTRNITQNVATSFIDTEDDHNIDRPPAGVIGWASDSKSVLLHDNWNVWQVPVAAGTAVNLTVNGKAEAIRYQNRFALERPQDRDKGIDLSKPLYFRAYGEWTKKAGIARVDHRFAIQFIVARDGDALAEALARRPRGRLVADGTIAQFFQDAERGHMR